MKSKEQKSEINLLYNQDIAPQDSEKTSFLYHKVLALQCIIATFSALSIGVAIVNYFFPSSVLTTNRSKDLILILTGLIMIARFLQTLSRIKWLKQKKDIQQSPTSEYISLFLNILLLIPQPNRLTYGYINVTTYKNTQEYLQIDDLFTVFLLFRFKYLFQFLVHSQLYYGSRPDRLSRLYAVKFGTYNAIKFLINEKPHLVLICLALVNYTILPIAVLITEGKINSQLNHFLACLHYVMVTQATVGYGNINVISIYGRVICIACITIGVLNSSLVLILFMRAMEQNTQEQQSHFLLTSLEKKVKLQKATVRRIQHQWVYMKLHIPPQVNNEKKEAIKRFRFNNKRQIMMDREEPINLKRMMISNFSSVIQQITAVKQKQQILSKYIKVIQKAKDQKEYPEATIRTKKQNKFRNSMVGKIVSN